MNNAGNTDISSLFKEREAEMKLGIVGLPNNTDLDTNPRGVKSSPKGVKKQRRGVKQTSEGVKIRPRG